MAPSSPMRFPRSLHTSVLDPFMHLWVSVAPFLGSCNPPPRILIFSTCQTVMPQSRTANEIWARRFLKVFETRRMPYNNSESPIYVAERRGPTASPLAELVHFSLGFLRRQFLILALCLTLGISGGIAYIVSTPPTYSTSALVLIDARTGQFSPERSVLGEAPVNVPSWSDSQLIIVRSENVLRSVVEKLNLTADPEFVARPSLLERWLPSFMNAGAVAARDSSPSDLALDVADALDRRLDVSRSGYVIEIKFRAHDPERAARIANAIAEAYLGEQIAAHSIASRRAAVWLQGRLDQLREQSASAEKAVAEFKQKNSIVAAEGKLISDQKLSDLNARLIEARTRTSEAQARLSRMESLTKDDPKSTITAVPDSLTNPIITKLRTEYLDLFHREADWSAKYGAQHRMVIKARERLREIHLSIHDELLRITGSYRSEYAVAKAREDAIQRQVEETIRETQKAGVAQIQLRTLESAAQSYRTLYNNFFQKFTEAEQASLNSNARVISPASQRSYVVHPRKPLVALIALFGGLAMGIGIGGLRELMDRALRTREQASWAVGVERVSVIPLLKEPTNSRATNLVPPSQLGARLFNPRSEIVRTIVNDPISPFSDSVRSIKMTIDSHDGPEQSRVIGFISALPGEGKSSLSLALAELIAQTGSRVTLVDCDFRKPSLSRQLAPSATVGLIDVLNGRVPLSLVQWTDARTGMNFIPNVAKRAVPHANEILNSAATKDLFDQLRASNDYVIVDLSPLAAGVDARGTEKFIDGYMFVVRWGQTTGEVVYQALGNAPGIQDKLLGVALNQVNLKQLGRYGDLGAAYYSVAA
jgi:polysaccharide biosynthesis transport protein